MAHVCQELAFRSIRRFRVLLCFLQRLFRPFSLRNIHKPRDRPEHFPASNHRLGPHFRGKTRTVCPPQQFIESMVAAPVLERVEKWALLDREWRPVTLRVMHQQMHILAQHLLARPVSEHPDTHRIAENAFPRRIYSIDCFARRFQQQPNALLLVRQTLLGGVAFADQRSQREPRNRQDQHQELQHDQPMCILRNATKRQDDSGIQHQDGHRRSAQSASHGHPDQRQEKQIEEFVGLRVLARQHDPEHHCNCRGKCHRLRPPRHHAPICCARLFFNRVFLRRFLLISAESSHRRQHKNQEKGRQSR